MLLTLSPSGLYSPPSTLHLDSPTAPGTVFVSHAHSDHCSGSARILCTPETAALHDARRGPREAITLRYGEPLQVADAEVTLMPAGHTLGSAMLVAESAEGRLAYTGDYKLRPNPFSPPVQIPRVDELVMECTFGEPRYRFPSEQTLLTQLFAFIDETLADGATPVLLAYALGKGQEVLWHLTGHGYDAVLHGAIANLCDLHVQLGYGFPGPGTWGRYVRGQIGPRVLLTTPGTRRTAMVQGLERKRICHLTGWALHPGAHNMYRDCDLVLPLSDHADFDELVRTATESGARRVWTTHGPATFAGELQARGIDAVHLAAHPQSAGTSEEGDAPPGAVKPAPARRTPRRRETPQLGFDLDP